MNRSQHSDIFSYEDASQDIPLSLTASQQEISSSYTPYVETGREKLIWGTSINVEMMAERFKEFVHGYGLEQLHDMHMTQRTEFRLDCTLLEEMLRKELVMYPQEVFPILEEAIRDVYQEKFIEAPGKISVRPTGLGEALSIRDVDPNLIDRVVCVTGMVVRVSAIIPEVRRAAFRCAKCGRETVVDAVKGTVNEPQKCECGTRLAFEIRHRDGEYSDTQIVKIQELPESIPEATTPMSVTVIARGSLVDALTPGDKVRITGVLKANPVRLNPLFKKIKSSFRVFLEMLGVEPLNVKEKQADDMVEQIDALRRRSDVYEVLSRSIAPSIYGLGDVKKGLLLQLVKGVPVDLGNSQLRGDINVLLAGDPGISKSQLLGFIHKISDRGMYTSGRGSSAVGLTASVSKDPDSGQFILESGALVLSDNGICCIDEFDKMSESTRSVLHEAMEQQTVSLAKAGIITTLNARCSILASCNPIESKYNLKKTIIENINIPPTLMSRFDLVFLLIDKADEINDKHVATHILDLYTNTNEVSSNPSYVEALTVIPIELLKAYIKEATKIRPVLTEESIELLSEAYVELRQLDNGETITATTRQLESLVRLSKAHAKVRFSHVVEAQDVKEAVRLIKESILLYAVDPRTGKIDINMILTGRSASHTRLVDDLKKAILLVLKTKATTVELLEKTNADERLLREALDELDLEEVIYYNRQTGSVEKIK